MWGIKAMTSGAAIITKKAPPSNAALSFRSCMELREGLKGLIEIDTPKQPSTER